MQGGLDERHDPGETVRRRDSALRESLLKVHEIAAAYFRDQLAAPGGSGYLEMTGYGTTGKKGSDPRP